MRPVSSAIRARSAASFAFAASACAESAGSAIAARLLAHRIATSAALQRELKRRFIAGWSSSCKHTSLVAAAILARPKRPNCARRMQRLLEYLSHHPYLAGATLLAAIVR